MKSLSTPTKIFILILIIAAGVRFYNFPNRINFGPEQAMSLITSGNYLKEKFSLLGQVYFRTTSQGHSLYADPLFSYSLVPWQWIFKFDPLPITAYFALLNLLAGGLTFFLFRRLLNQKIALFASILFLFNSYMIKHSLFIWIINYFPLLGVLAIFLLYKFHKSQRLNLSLLIGLLSGIGFGLDYMYTTSVFLTLVVVVWLAKKKWQSFFVYSLGTAAGILPTIIFDLKHNFYHLKTLLGYTLDTFVSPGDKGLRAYHFFQYWPALCLLGGFIIYKVFQRSKLAAIALTLFYIYFNLTSNQISMTKAVGMADGLTLAKQKQTAEIIALDHPQQFNIASLLDFDSQAHPLRYLTYFVYGFKPEEIDQYPRAENIYVFALKNYNFNQAIAWEINSFKPFKVKWVKNIDQNYTVYKLTKP